MNYKRLDFNKNRDIQVCNIKKYQIKYQQYPTISLILQQQPKYIITKKMGNSQLQQQSQPPSQPQQKQPPQSSSTSPSKKLSNQRYILQIRDRQIILDYKNKIKITIGDILSFPNGFQGLHLWDSNIILSRYILINKDIFNNKSVIQLLSGTGLASIIIKKYTKSIKIAATDKLQQIIINISKNCQKNNINQGMIITSIKWQQFINKQNNIKFDYIIGADLLYKGCPIQILINILNKLLNIGGKAIFIIPYINVSKNKNNKNNNQEDKTGQFVQLLLKQNIFSFKKQKLVDQIYLQSPLLNQVQGYQEFKQISEGIFYVYTIQKIRQKNVNNSNTGNGNTIKDNSNNNENIKILQQPVLLSKKSSKQKKQNTIPIQQSPKIAIKDQILQGMTQQQQKNKEQHIKKQLEIVTIHKTQDQPAYIRNKNKSITQIIAQKQQQQNPTNNNNNNSNMKVQNNRKSSQNQQNNQIQVVNKQHQLFNQPRKKSDFDKNSYNQENQKLQERDN